METHKNWTGIPLISRNNTSLRGDGNQVFGMVKLSYTSYIDGFIKETTPEERDSYMDADLVAFPYVNGVCLRMKASSLRERG